jgi:hypothetical protein
LPISGGNSSASALEMAAVCLDNGQRSPRKLLAAVVQRS